MTADDAKKIAAVVAVVDGGCSVCVRAATEALMRDFPNVDWKTLLKDQAAARQEYWYDEVDEWAAAEVEE